MCQSTVWKAVTSLVEMERNNACGWSSHFLSENKACRVAPLPHLSQLRPIHAFAQLCNYIRVRAEVQQLIDVHLPRAGDPEPAKPPEQRPLEVQQEGI